MEWLLANPQIHSTFSSLGCKQGDTYTINPDVLVTLGEINYKLSCEDQTLRTYRRAIGFGQNVKNDLIPLLIHAKDPGIIDATIRILVNLTVPVECLFSVDVMYRTEVGRHTIFEINKLLITSKEAFTEPRSTKAIIDFIKIMLEDRKKLSNHQCEVINNCLLLLRNILHIPEDNIVTQRHCKNTCTSMQNQILWNLFTQSIDKMLIHLMSCPQRSTWSVTIVQLIALIYKDQNVNTLQKLLNIWFETSLSESSEDNESNTSPPKQGSGDSSPMLTSEPTSVGSEVNIGLTMVSYGKREKLDNRRSCMIINKETETTLQQLSRLSQELQNSKHRTSGKQQSASYQTTEHIQPAGVKHSLHKNNNKTKDTKQKIKVSSQNGGNHVNPGPSTTTSSPPSSLSSSGSGINNSANSNTKKGELRSSQSETSDCGYGTQLDNPESISTSSNEEDIPQQKPVHQKPPNNQKHRYNPSKKSRIVVTAQEKKEWRRKKLVKRSKSNLINMKGLVQHTPTDEDISHILKEFTVDILLKGYGHIVHELHAQLLSDFTLQIDTSHFFWLVTYFLKFATQLELDLEHINSVLSFNIISYLTYEGVNLCEQIELASLHQGRDLKPFLRRIHLVVAAIRELMQALETYTKLTHLSEVNNIKDVPKFTQEDDRNYLRILQQQINAAEDIRCLFLLLIRKYNSNLQSKQYLQDLVVTNHLLLLLFDGIARNPDNQYHNRIMKHMSQFATVEVMHQYGLLLQSFQENGEFVNDCIFTMMHHVGGDLGQIVTLFQPNILKTFSQIWKTEYGLCDDWSDLISYVINKFTATPQNGLIRMPTQSLTEMTKEHNMETTICPWTQDEIDTLYWYYVQSKKCRDVVGKILTLFQNNGNKQKSRISIIQQLLQQDIITLVEYDDLMNFEDAEYEANDLNLHTQSMETGESNIEITDPAKRSPNEIEILRDRLLKEDKGKMIAWLQKVLLESCFVKLSLSQDLSKPSVSLDSNKKHIVIMEPVPHHCLLKRKPIPIVPYNNEQASILLNQSFVLLLHKLGFHLPDPGRLFVRIPEFWTAEIMFNIANRLGPIDQSIIKFDLSLLNVIDTNTLDVPPSEGSNSGNEAFVLPRSKHTNPLIRYTPDPIATPSIPNWLQVVMKSKNILIQPDSSIGIEFVSTPIDTMKIDSPIDEREKLYGRILDESGAPAGSLIPAISSFGMTSVQRKTTTSNNICNEMVASMYNQSNWDTIYVTTNLTRMYVSDEDDKQNLEKL